VKKKKMTNGSRHELLPEYDLVDVIGKRSKQAYDAPESGKRLGMLSLPTNLLLSAPCVTVARKDSLLCC
jgi:hypothetical protein